MVKIVILLSNFVLEVKVCHFDWMDDSEFGYGHGENGHFVVKFCKI